MPKRLSNRLDHWLLAYKGSKPQRQKVYDTKSTYGGLNQATFDGPFGSGTSSISAKDPATGQRQINTSMSLAPQLQQAGDTAMTGLNSNLGYLQRDPNEQVSYLRSGQDPLYNVLNEQSQRSYDTNLGRLKLDAMRTGASNSTAAGAAYGKMMTDKNLLDNQNLLQTLGYGNQTATQNANTNLGAIGNLAQLAYPLGSAANAQLNTGLQAQDRAYAATAQSKNAAEANYQQAMNQYNAQQANQPFGGALGAYGKFIDPLGFSVDPAKATGQFASIAGGAMGAGAGVPYIPQSFGSSQGFLQSPNFGNVSGYGSSSPLFGNLSSPVY